MSMHIGQWELTPAKLLGVLGFIVAVLYWANVSVAGLPLIAVALVLVSLAILL